MIKVTFDANIWYSFVRGGKIAKKISLLLDISRIQVLTCQVTLNEYDDVTSRPKAQKDLIPERIKDIRKLMLLFTELAVLFSPIEIISRDPNDDYLLHFSKEYDLDYLVTGDKDLLVLKTYGKTQICTFAEFVADLEKQSLI